MRLAIPAAALAVLALAPAPAAADEIEDTIRAALEAYRAGDLDRAKEELDFASALVAQAEAGSLATFLPEPLPGWAREETGEEPGAMAAFGMGLTASAAYTRGVERVVVRIVAESPIVAGLAQVFSNPALMGAAGTVRRIQGQRALVTAAGEVQVVVDGRVLVQIEGTADEETRIAYLEAMDLEGLAEF